jgi:pimeloyl-ACP methyl ester carboxylesterase
MSTSWQRQSPGNGLDETDTPAGTEKHPADESFVLVHGSCHGGWCWARVARRLRAAGHEVFVPTLTGFGERAHLLSPGLGPATLVEDVVAVLEYEDLGNVVLVGHSFGALVNLEVADRIPERLARLVMIDGLVVEPGQAGFDGLPKGAAEQRRAAAEAYDGGLSYPSAPATAFGLSDPDDVAWVNQRLTPHPLRTYAEPFAHRTLGNGLPVIFITCTDPPFSAVAPSHPIARREGWTWRELASCHDAMIKDPDLTTAELLR